MAFGDAIVATVLGGPSTPSDSNAAGNAIAEGAAVNTPVGITAASTSPSGAVTYALTSDSSGGGFKIDPNTGVVTVADPSKIDFESSPGRAYTITTRASDANGSSSTTFTIGVTDVAPSAPVDSNAAANTVLEGAAAGTLVGVTASSTDVSGGAVTYSLTGDSSGRGFTINATTGVISVADGSKIDYESSAGHAYTVTAQASDGTLTSSQAFTINVGDVPLTTPVDANGASNSVAEGVAAGTIVGITASASDPNGPATTYSLIGDTSGGGFTINASTGVVTVANAAKLDFENTAPGHTYNITVQATNGTTTTSQVFTVGVTDVAPSTPTDGNGPAGGTVAEGAANGTAVGVTASSTDVNGGAITYSLIGDTSGGGFTINATTGVITVADATKINYETAPGHAYSVTAQASDGTLSNSQSFTIAVTDVAPSAPTDSDGTTNTVAEGAANGSSVGIIASSTDVNGPGVTYSLVGDTSGGGFTINATTGVVTVADATRLDYETSGVGHSYSVTAQASDGTLSSSQSFTIAVTDVAPSAPADVNNATNTIAEGAANGSAVGITASAADPNGPAASYLLTDNAGGRFAIDTNSGVVTVANGAAIDFETAPGHAYGITVQATSGALTSSTAFSIGVSDVGPSTPADTDGNTNSVFEGAVDGTAVGITATSSDPGGGPAPTYTLSDNAGGRFAIDASSGIVTVANGAAIDFETAPGPGHSYGITVLATSGALSTTQTFSIGVGDVNEAPAGTDKTVTMLEGDSYTFSVADFGFSDPSDSVNPNSLLAVKMTTVPGAGTGTFTNNGVTVNAGDSVSAANIAGGLLVFTPTAHANGSPEATFTFHVQDNGGTANGGVDLDQSPNTVTINVNAVNDAPVNSVPLAAQNVNEEGSFVFSAGTGNAITISDVDVGSGNETVTLTVTGGTLALGSHAGLVSFSPDNAASITLTGTVANVNAALDGLTYTGNLNFHGNDTLVVGTNDNGNTGAGGPKTDSDNVSITVTDVADTPSVANATTNEDTQSASGLIVSRNATDGTDVAFFKITGIANGTLFQSDGTTAISNGDFITYAQANAGLKFTPSADFFGNGSFNVQASTSNSDAGLGGSVATATVTVNAVADTPSVTNATTSEDTQSASGLVVSHNAVDGAEIGFVKITGITNGTLFQNDGTTAINNGDFITYAQANAGLKFTPSADFFGNGSFNVQASTSNSDAGLGGSVATATVTVNAVADTPSVTNATTSEDTQSASGLVVSHNAADGAEVGFVKVTGIANGTLFQNDGTTAINNGDFITYAQANAGLKFTPSADFFGNGSFNVQASTSNSDAGLGGSVATATVTVTPVNDAPTLTAHDRDPVYAPGVQLFDSASVSVGPANESAQNIKQLVLSVSNVDGTGTSDHLSIDGTDVFLTNGNTAVGANHGVNIAVALAGGTATVTISKTTGDIAAADVASIVNGLTYTNDDITGGEAARHVTLTSIQDTGGTSPGADARALSIDSTVNFNVPPVVTAGHTLNYTENQAATAFDTAITVTDADNANLASATVQITGGYVIGQDVLAFTDQNGITGSFDAGTGKLTLTGPSSVANYQTALASVTYFNTSDNPSGAARTVTIIANDGVINSTPVTDTINVTPVNDKPVLTASAFAPSFTEDGAATQIDNNFTISDVDSTTLQSATLVLDATGYQNGADTLSFSNAFGITTTGFNAATRTLTLTGPASLANWNSALDSVTFSTTSQNPGTSRVVHITVDDGGVVSNLSTTVDKTIAVTGVNDHPVIANVSGTLNYTENDTATAIASGLTVADVDSANLASATVHLTTGYVQGEDILSFTDGGGIVGSFNAATGTLTLTPSGATATVAQFQTALDNVKYSNTSDNPSTPDRTVEFQANDGGAVDNLSNVATKTIHVIPVNDAPTAASFNFASSSANDAIGNTSLVLNNTFVPGAPDPAGLQKTINGSLLTGASDADGPGPLVTVAQNNVATPHGHVTVNTSGEFSYTPNAGYIGTDTFNYQISDQYAGGSGPAPGVGTGSITVNVAAPKVWYIDSVNGTASGDGTSDNPFDSLADVSGASGPDQAGDIIYLASGNYTGGITLLTNQTLVGAGAALIVGTVTLAPAGAAPTLTNAAGNAITLASGNTVLGVAIGDTSGAGIFGSDVGTLVIQDVSDTGTGKIIDITGAAGNTTSITFDTATTTSSGSEAIRLVGINGSFTATGGSIAGASGTDVLVSGGTAVVNIASSIASNAGGAIEVTGRGAGSSGVTLSGALNITGGTGISVHDNTSGTTTFSGASKVINTGAGNAVDLANNTGATTNFTNGSLDIDTTSGIGFKATGGGTVTVQGSGNTINSSTGAAIDIHGATIGASGVNFGSTTAGGGANGIHLQGVTGGAIALGSGSISGTTGAAFLVGDGAGTSNTGGTAAITYNGSITSTGTARVVDIEDRAAGAGNITLSGTITHSSGNANVIFLDDNAAGSITFSGNNSALNGGTSSAIAISDQTGGTVSFSGSALKIDATSGAGVNLSSNTGGTINFTGGGLDIDTTSGTGFNASGGGTVTVQGSGNSITSTTGTALNVTNTTIGANDLSFQSISAGTGSGSAGNAITLDTTGPLGGLHVTGNGSTVGASGGGVIQHKTGADGSTSQGIGIYLNNTSDVQLNGMQLNDFDNFAIRGNNVIGFALSNSNISGVSGSNFSFDEGAIRFGAQDSVSQGLLGTANFLGNTISGGFEDNVDIYNYGTGNLNVTFADSAGRQAIIGAPSLAGNDGIYIETGGGTGGQGSGFNLTATVNGVDFTGAHGDLLQVVAADKTTQNITITNNSFHNTQANSLGGGIYIGGGGNQSNYSITYNVSNNDFKGAASNALHDEYDGLFGAVSGVIQGNTIGTPNGTYEGAIAQRGSSTGNGINLIAQKFSGGGLTHAVRIEGNQIGDVAGTAGIYMRSNSIGGAGTKVEGTILNNTVKDMGPLSMTPFYALVGGQDLTADNSVLGLNMVGNTFDNTGAGSDPSGTQTNAVVLDQVSENAHFYLPGYAGSPDGEGFGGTASTNISAFLINAAHHNTLTNSVFGFKNTTEKVDAYLVSGATGAAFTLAVPLLAASGGVQAASTPTPGETHLTQAQLDTVVAAAIAQWAHAGASAAQLAALAAVTFSVGDLSGTAIGEQGPGAHITIDTDAAGHGWFVDATPNDNSEFTHASNADGTDLYTDPSHAAAGHLDLLTAVTHELGHVLGLSDVMAPADDLMYLSLVDGERRLPDAANVAQVTASGAVQAEAALPLSAQAATGTPIVAGTAGNDTINAGHGGDILFGGAGADTFVFGPSTPLDAPTAAQITHVADYSAALGDTFDFSAITSAFHYSGVSDSLVVRAVEDASGKFAMLQVDHIDPMGLPSAPNWVSVAQLDGAHAGDTLNVLIDSHSALHLAQIHVDLI